MDRRIEFAFGFLAENYPQHSDGFWEFHVPYLGSGVLLGAGFRVPLQPNVITASPPGEVHALEVASPLAFHIVRVWDPGDHLPLFERIAAMSRGDDPLVLDEPARFRVDRWRVLAARKDVDAQQAVWFGWVALLHELSLGGTAANPLEEDDDILRAVRFMEMNVQRKLSLEELAAAANTTRYGLAHRFRARVGVPPIEYFLRMKCEAACFLLRETERTSREIATWLGFSDEFHFSKTFKAKTGESPRRYRRRKREQSDLVLEPTLEEELRGRHEFLVGEPRLAFGQGDDEGHRH